MPVTGPTRGRRASRSCSRSAATAPCCARPSWPARPKAPLLGINLGKVGFLAEAEIGDLDQAVRRRRRAGDVHRGRAAHPRRHAPSSTARPVAESWALNEVSVEKGAREQMLELLVEVDGRPLSRYGCDGVVCATPTGSTAYAFSAGGPVVWPEVEALLLVPISAHALFSRPLVTAPTSTIAITVDPYTPFARAVLRRPAGHATCRPARGSTVRRGALPVRVVRLRQRPFTDRLVAKFGLPVDGWRGNGADRHALTGSDGHVSAALRLVGAPLLSVCAGGAAHHRTRRHRGHHAAARPAA